MPASEGVLRLKSGRERSLALRHPWIFSGAIDSVEGNPGPGDTVDVVTADGAFAARAAYSPASQIRARVWCFDPDRAIDGDFFVHACHARALPHARRCSTPTTRRAACCTPSPTGCRA